MLLHPTLEKLRALKLPGMARALEEQQSQRDIGSFTFEERLGLLLDHESTLRDGKVLAARLSRAKLKLAAGQERPGGPSQHCCGAVELRQPAPEAGRLTRRQRAPGSLGAMASTVTSLRWMRASVCGEF